MPDFLIIVRYLSERGGPSAVDRLHFILDIIDAMLGTGAPDSRAAAALARNPAAAGKTTDDVTQPEDADEARGATPEQEMSRLDRKKAPPEAHIFAGRLTDFDNIDKEQRPKLLANLLHEGLYEELIPEEFAHVLCMYPDAPARLAPSTMARSGPDH